MIDVFAGEVEEVAQGRDTEAGIDDHRHAGRSRAAESCGSTIASSDHTPCQADLKPVDVMGCSPDQLGRKARAAPVRSSAGPLPMERS